jgi:hypothetical protein
VRVWPHQPDSERATEPTSIFTAPAIGVRAFEAGWAAGAFGDGSSQTGVFDPLSQQIAAPLQSPLLNYYAQPAPVPVRRSIRRETDCVTRRCA